MTWNQTWSFKIKLVSLLFGLYCDFGLSRLILFFFWEWLEFSEDLTQPVNDLEPRWNHPGNRDAKYMTKKKGPHVVNDTLKQSFLSFLSTVSWTEHVSHREINIFWMFTGCFLSYSLTISTELTVSVVCISTEYNDSRI